MAKSDKESVGQVTYRLVAEQGSEKYVIERIREEMEKRGWSQAELSRRMGGVLSQGVLSKMLRGGEYGRGRHVSIDQLITLSKVFSVPLDELLVPEGTMAHIRGWRYLMEAADLQAEFDFEYDKKLTWLGLALRRSPGLLKRLREYRDELRAKLEREQRELWGDFYPGETEPTEEQLAKAMQLNRYPALVAVEDALKRHEAALAREEGERDE